MIYTVSMVKAWVGYKNKKLQKNFKMKHIQTFENFLSESQINESSYTSAMDDFTIALSNVKKVGKNITCDATIVFTDKSDIQPYLDNELDNVNGDILDWAQSQGIVKSDDYSSGFDGKPSISGNKVTGKFTFFAA